MVKIVVALKMKRIEIESATILEASGIPVKVSCRSGAEAIRAIGR
jgi:hypothetical protein